MNVKNRQFREANSQWKTVSALYFLFAIPGVPAMFIVAMVMLGPQASGGASNLINPTYFNTYLAIIVHGISGAMFFISLPMQYSNRIKAYSARWHKIMGRVAVCSACTMAISGVWMHHVLSPHELGARYVSLIIFSVAICFCFIIATYFAIRKNLKNHTVWMSCAVASALAVITPLFLAVPVNVFVEPSSTLKAYLDAMLYDYDRVIALCLNLTCLAIYRARKPAPQSLRRPLAQKPE